MTDEHKKLFDGKKWTMVMHLNAGDCRILQHSCKALGISRVIRTPKVKGQWGHGVASYYRDGSDTEYTSLEDLADAILAANSEPTT